MLITTPVLSTDGDLELASSSIVNAERKAEPIIDVDHNPTNIGGEFNYTISRLYYKIKCRDANFIFFHD